MPLSSLYDSVELDDDRRTDFCFDVDAVSVVVAVVIVDGVVGTAAVFGMKPVETGYDWHFSSNMISSSILARLSV